MRLIRSGMGTPILILWQPEVENQFPAAEEKGMPVELELDGAPFDQRPETLQLGLLQSDPNVIEWKNQNPSPLLGVSEPLSNGVSNSCPAYVFRVTWRGL